VADACRSERVVEWRVTIQFDHVPRWSHISQSVSQSQSISHSVSGNLCGITSQWPTCPAIARRAKAD